jgi:molybdate transport system substrate-binding protein
MASSRVHPLIRWTASSLIQLAAVALSAAVAAAAEVMAAVAANFTAPMREIAAGFERATGHTVLASYGSTGTLYAQILNGAPFDVFLAADQERPRLLASDGRASEPFTYAVGTLVLWSADPDLVDAAGEVLRQGAFRRIAIANPKTAPYGAAAVQLLEALGVRQQLQDRVVQGESVTQAYQFVATGNAELGFVALSQVVLAPGGSSWPPPRELYDPIRQDAALLERGEGNPAAAALLQYLKSPEARAVIRRYGYDLE